MTARQARKARRAAEREARKLAEKQQHSAPAPSTEPVEPAPISEAKLAANRANAQKSTGPKSIEGRTRSSRNSFKHGLYSKQLVLPGEDPAELDALKANLRAEHQPVSETEEILVNEMAEQYWRLRRARRLETDLLASDQIALTHLAAIQRMMSSAERGFHKALNALRQLQKERGFVPGNSHSTESAEPPVAEPRLEGAVELTAVSCELIAASGFVPANFHSTESAEPPVAEPRPKEAVQLTAVS